MAKAFRTPREIRDPDDLFSQAFKAEGGFDHQAYMKAVEEWTEELRTWCKQTTDSKSDLVGEVYSSQIADGYASYMVWRTKPLELIHMPIGDGWQLPEPHIRGLRVSDIRAEVGRAKQLRKLFS